MCYVILIGYIVEVILLIIQIYHKQLPVHWHELARWHFFGFELNLFRSNIAYAMDINQGRWRYCDKGSKFIEQQYREWHNRHGMTT